MKLSRPSRPRYADIVATLALFLAMGGTAYAVTVHTADIADGAVTTPKLHNGAVTNPKIAAGAVSSGKIVGGGVLTVNLADASVTSAKIATGAVGSQQLANGSVTSGQLANGSVTAAKLVDGAVTHTKLAADSVSGSNVTNNSITLSDIVGINATGAISFHLGANSCGQLTLTVSGAHAGDLALLSWTDTVPSSVVLGPLKVVSATQIVVRGCNESASGVTQSNIGVRVVTFG